MKSILRTSIFTGTFFAVALIIAGMAVSAGTVNISLLDNWDGSSARNSDVYGFENSQGRYAFMGTKYESKGVEVLDLNDPSNVTRVATWYGRSCAWPGCGNDIEVLEIRSYAQYIVIGSRWDGVYIVDATDINNPVELSSFYNDELHNLTMGWPYVYVASNESKWVQVYDISTPTIPTYWGQIAGANGDAHGVTAQDGRLCIATNESNGKTSLYDVSVLPAPPVLLNSWSTGNSSHSCSPNADWTYLTVEHELNGGGMGIWDISNPASPIMVAELDPSSFGWGGKSVHQSVWLENTLYVAWGGIGFTVFDMTDPANPTLLDSISTGGGSNKDDGLWAVYPFGDGLVIGSDWHTGFWAWDVQIGPPPPPTVTPVPPTATPMPPTPTPTPVPDPPVLTTVNLFNCTFTVPDTTRCKVQGYDQYKNPMDATIDWSVVGYDTSSLTLAVE